MANKRFSQFTDNSVTKTATPPSPASVGKDAPQAPDKTANWPTHGGTSGPMGKGFPKVKQSAKTTL